MHTLRRYSGGSREATGSHSEGGRSAPASPYRWVHLLSRALSHLGGVGNELTTACVLANTAAAATHTIFNYSLRAGSCARLSNVIFTFWTVSYTVWAGLGRSSAVCYRAPATNHNALYRIPSIRTYDHRQDVFEMDGTITKLYIVYSCWEISY